MNVNYYRDELISEIVMKFEETQEQFIFQTISDFTSNVYQIEIDKQELIDAITLIRKSRGADIIFKDPKIRLGYVAGYDDGKIDAEREREKSINHNGIWCNANYGRVIKKKVKGCKDYEPRSGREK